ncbi:hypothetical protein F5879DRAFT_988955 [Lentinula edodes]|nr:hypothetical protein F5879DRAFT_988955 [Lentinula edodes]
MIHTILRCLTFTASFTSADPVLATPETLPRSSSSDLASRGIPIPARYSEFLVPRDDSLPIGLGDDMKLTIAQASEGEEGCEPLNCIAQTDHPITTLNSSKKTFGISCKPPTALVSITPEGADLPHLQACALIVLRRVSQFFVLIFFFWSTKLLSLYDQMTSPRENSRSDYTDLNISGLLITGRWLKAAIDC